MMDRLKSKLDERKRTRITMLVRESDLNTLSFLKAHGFIATHLIEEYYDDTAEDAIELMLAGASLVGIGTALADHGASLFGEIAKGMETWCTSEGVRDVSALTGAMHRELIKRGMKGTSMKHS